MQRLRRLHEWDGKLRPKQRLYTGHYWYQLSLEFNIYRPQRTCGQGYVFTCVCDSVHRGVWPIACWHIPSRTKGRHPPWDQKLTPPGPKVDPPSPPHPGPRADPPAYGTNAQAQPVRILLECILVSGKVSFWWNSDRFEHKCLRSFETCNPWWAILQ